MLREYLETAIKNGQIQRSASEAGAARPVRAEEGLQKQGVRCVRCVILLKSLQAEWLRSVSTVCDASIVDSPFRIVGTVCKQGPTQWQHKPLQGDQVWEPSAKIPFQ